MNNLRLAGGTATRTFDPRYEIGAGTGTKAVEIGGPSEFQRSEFTDDVWRFFAQAHQQASLAQSRVKIFYKMASRWKEETKFSSSATEMFLNPAYQRIIGLGPDVVPLLLEDLAEYGGHWFLALQSITGENPVAEEDVGRPKKMTSAWLDWGRSKGLI